MAENGLDSGNVRYDNEGGFSADEWEKGSGQFSQRIIDVDRLLPNFSVALKTAENEALNDVSSWSVYGETDEERLIKKIPKLHIKIDGILEELIAGQEDVESFIVGMTSDINGTQGVFNGKTFRELLENQNVDHIISALEERRSAVVSDVSDNSRNDDHVATVNARNTGYFGDNALEDRMRTAGL